MKKLIFTVLCAQILSSAAFAYKEGGGGDPVEQEFFALGKAAVERAKTSTLLTEVQKTRLVGVFDKAILQATDEQLVNRSKVTKTAINIPDKGLIFISRALWSRVSAPELKQGIALHEYLGLAEIESDVYTVSASVLHLNEQLLAKSAVAEGMLFEDGVYSNGGVSNCALKVVTNGRDNLTLQKVTDLVSYDRYYPAGQSNLKSYNGTYDGKACYDPNFAFVNFKCEGNVCRGALNANKYYQLEISPDKKQVRIFGSNNYKTRVLGRSKTVYGKVTTYTFRPNIEQKKMITDMIGLLDAAIATVEDIRTQAVNKCLWDLELQNRATVLNYKRTFFEEKCVLQIGQAAEVKIKAITSSYSTSRVAKLLNQTFYMRDHRDTRRGEWGHDFLAASFNEEFSEGVTVQGLVFGSFLYFRAKEVIIENDLKMFATNPAEFMSQLDLYKTNFELLKAFYQENLKN